MIHFSVEDKLNLRIEVFIYLDCPQMHSPQKAVAVCYRSTVRQKNVYTIHNSILYYIVRIVGDPHDEIFLRNVH